MEGQRKEDRKRLFHGGARVNLVLSFLQFIVADLALSRKKRIDNFIDNYPSIFKNITPRA